MVLCLRKDGFLVKLLVEDCLLIVDSELLLLLDLSTCIIIQTVSFYNWYMQYNLPKALVTVEANEYFEILSQADESCGIHCSIIMNYMYDDKYLQCKFHS